MRRWNGNRGKPANLEPTLTSVPLGATIPAVDGKGDPVIGKGKLGAMKWQTSRRRYAQSRQDPHSAPAIIRLFEENAPAAHREAVVFGSNLQWPTRFFARERRRIGRPAEFLHRTDVALRANSADEGAQFHEGGVVLAGVSSRQEPGGVRPELFAPRASIDRRLQIEQARENARGVCFNDGDSSIERERRDGIRGVATDPRQRADGGRRVRKMPAMFFRDRDRCGPQISRARIVAEPLPGVENVIFRSRGKCCDVGKPPQPFIIIRDHGGDLGLLEHDLGNEDGVRIVGVTPTQIAAVFAEPATESAAKGWSEIRSHVKKTSNAQRRTSNAEFRVFHSILDVGRWALDVCPSSSNDFLHSFAHVRASHEAARPA